MLFNCQGIINHKMLFNCQGIMQLTTRKQMITYHPRIKIEQNMDTKTIPAEDEYVQRETNKLSQDANTLFPNWELFGFIENDGCSPDYVKNVVNERIILDGTFFDIVCHISEKGTCYNYIRFKKHNKLRLLSTWMEDKYDDTYKYFFNSKATRKITDKNIDISESENVNNMIKDCSKKTKDIDIIYGGKQDIQKLYQKNFDIKKYNKKCFFHITENNRSIGIFIIFDKNDKKYAIICNHTNKDDINKVKEDLREKYTIINLPRVQSDNHSCSVLNKIFLTEMHKFFVEDKHDINELLSYKDKEDNNGDIALIDKVKTLFPNLYQYQQYNVASNNCIPNNFKSNLLVTDKYNIIKDKENPNEDKIFNLGLLRKGWSIAIDFISENINNVPLCELEIFMEIFEKQCNFFDRVIQLQTQNIISTNKDYFANRQTAIEKIKTEIENRQNNRKNNGEEKMCDFIFDTTLTSQILSRYATAISPKFCEYVERYKTYFGDKIYKRSQEKSAKNETIQHLINGKVSDENHFLHQLGKKEYNGKNKRKFDIDENVGNIIQRAQPFEGNEAIIIGLRKEYQEKYNTHDNIINNNLTDKNIIGNKTSNDDTINKEDHKSKANHNCNICECNNLCSCFGSSSGQQKVDF